jgi:hypothetical protein
MRIAEVPPPSPRGARPGSSRRLLLDSFTIPVRTALESNQLRTRAPTARFQRGAFPVGQPSIEERGEIESHAVRRALVSSEARLPGRFTLHACAGRDSNPHVRRHTVLSRARLPVLRHQRERERRRRSASGRSPSATCSLIIGRSGPGGVPLPTLAVFSRSAHGSTRYCIP